MELKTALSSLEHSPLFSDWKKQHKESFLSHAFQLPQDGAEWQLGYFHKGNGKITTFVVTPQDVSLRPQEEVFSKDPHDIKPLEMSSDLLPFSTIIQSATSFQQSLYPKDPSMKTISLLQNLPQFGNVWNLTLVTRSFNTLNIKLDPRSGKVVDHKISSIFSFRQKDA